MGETGDQGWWDQETASTLGKRRRRWGTMLVLSSHPASHRPKSLGQVHNSHAGCHRGDTGTLAPGASVPLSPGERLLVPCTAPLCCSALAALSSSACTSTTCAVCRTTPLQSSGVEGAQLGKSVLAASLVQAATRLSTDIGHDIDLWPLTFLFWMHSNNTALLNTSNSRGIIGKNTAEIVGWGFLLRCFSVAWPP